MKTLSREQAYKVYDDILAVDVTALQPATDTRVYMDRFAKMLRTELKTLGFSNRQISVRVPNYAMAQAIEVRLPHIEDTSREYDDYVRRAEAERHLRDIIDALFPRNFAHYGEGGVYSDSYYMTYSVG